MSSTQLALPQDIPAYIREQAAKNAEQNKEALGGIKAGSFPRISIGGSKFSIVEGGEKVLLTDPDKPDLPAMELQVAVVGFNRGVSKLYYEGEFEEGSDKEPSCSSDDGVTADPHIVNSPSPNRSCASCPKNVWGSKITKQGKQVKACSDNKRLVVISAHDLANDVALDLTIKPATLKNWAEYVRALDSKGISVDNVVTKIQFDPSATFPKLVFKFGRFMTVEEIAVAAARSKGDDVRLITSPRASTATGPVPAPQGVPAATPAPAPQAPAAPAAPAPAPQAPAAPKAPVAPVAPAAPAPAPQKAPEKAPETPVAVDPYAGQPPHVKVAVESSGGLNSETGAQVYKALTGKDVPVAAPAKPIDPYEGQPAHVKLAVEAAGGLDSVAGKATYAALVPNAKTAEAPKRTRAAGKKADIPAPQPVTTATVATTAAVSAPAPAASFATPPAGAVGGLGSDLDTLLASAMSVPTGTK